MMRRLLLGVLVVLVIAVVIAGFWSRTPDVDSGALSRRLEVELQMWKLDLTAREPSADERLKPFAVQVGAPWPAARPDPGSPPVKPDPEEALARTGVEAARRLLAEGQPVESVELLLALIRYGEDARAGRGFDVEFHPAVEAGEKTVRDLVRDQALSGEALTRAINFERERLKKRPHPAEAWRYRVLEAEVLLRGLARGEISPDGIDWAGPVDGFFGEKDPDYLLALSVVQGWFRKFLTAQRADDDEALDAIAEQIREDCSRAPESVSARVAAAILVYGDLARDNYESWLRTREARLFGMLMLRYKEQHGAFPEDLESIRVEEIPESPHGGTWRLGIDRETKKPGIFLDGGRVYSYQVLAPQEGDFHSDRETKPLFSFR